MTNGSTGPDKPSSDAAPPVDSAQIGKLLLEVGPIAVFFIANSQGGIFVGTAWFMAATVIALTASRVLFGRIPLMPLISGFFILVFGALTLVLNDELFIKMKPTILNTLFSITLFVGLAFGHSLLRYPFGDAFRLTDEGWRLLTRRWAVFFLFLAVLNEVVWRSFSSEFWIAFKLWGIMPITMIFAVAQIGLLKKFELPGN